MQIRLLRQYQKVVHGFLRRRIVFELVDELDLSKVALAHFTKRQRDVLQLIQLTNKEIATELHLTERTVKFHVSELFKKTGYRKRAELTLMGLTSTGDQPREAAT
jgi:DNA-binding NarL/FixJ family response regulator